MKKQFPWITSSLLALISLDIQAQSFDPFSLVHWDAFYEEFTAETNLVLANAGLAPPPPTPSPAPTPTPSCGCNFVPPAPSPLPGPVTGTLPTPDSTHYRLVVRNNTGLPDSDVWVLAKGTDVNPPNTAQGYVQFTSGVGAFVPVPNLCTFASTYSVQLSTLPQVGSDRVLQIPLMISGRMYFAIGQPMWLDTPAVDTIADPTGANAGASLQDVSFYTLYDKIEFTFAETSDLFINPTAVDFFSLPINLVAFTNGGQTIPNGDGDAYVGFNMPRAALFNYATQTMSCLDQTRSTTPANNRVWSNLFIPFLTNPYAPATGSNLVEYLRIESPHNLTPSTVPVPTPPPTGATFYETPIAFPYNYLLNPSYGYNYVDSLFNFYTTNQVKIDATEIKSAFCPSCTDQQLQYIGQVQGNEFVFQALQSGGPSSTLMFSKPTVSFPFFAGSDLFTPTEQNNTPQAIITRQLTSAFDVGILPIALSSVTVPGNFLNQTFFGQYKASPGYYTNNGGAAPCTTGPWYDLYSKTFHSVPFGSEGNVPIYTFAYDDELLQGGLLHPSGTDINQTSYVLITLGDLTGTVIPDIQDDPMDYNVTFQYAADRPVQYRVGNSGSFTPIASGATATGISSRGSPTSSTAFQVQLADTNCVAQTQTIYLKYRNAVPLCTSDAGFTHGIVFSTPDPSNPQNVTLIFPGASPACSSPYGTPGPCPSCPNM